jgi:amino acid transporter
MQAFDSLLHHFDLAFAVPIVAVALAVGALAGMMSWLDGPAEGLLDIGREQGYLPPYFQKTKREGVEVRILAAQGVVITVIGLLYALVPTVSNAYWIFAAMATQVYLIMYVLLFISALKLRRAQPDHARGYRAPALALLCMLGGTSSVIAFLIGFVAPSQLAHTSPVAYALLILAGIFTIGILPPLLLLRFRKPSWKAPSMPDESPHTVPAANN